MTRLFRWTRWLSLALTGGILFTAGAGSCLPANFYADLLAGGITTAIDTIVAGIATAFIPVV